MRTNLIGAAQSTAQFAPTDSEAWVCGAHYDEAKHLNVTRIYEIHEIAFERLPYIEYLVSLGIPLIVAPGFPIKADHIREFDFSEAERLIDRIYLTSTMAYMMSDAIREGYSEIGLFGITLWADGEYFSQRPAMEWWRGYAEGKGAKIITPDNCPIGKSDFIYGKLEKPAGLFSEQDFLSMADQHQKRANEIQATIDQLQLELHLQLNSVNVYQCLGKVAKKAAVGEAVSRISDMLRVKHGADH